MYLYMQIVCQQAAKTHHTLEVISGGQDVDVELVFITFSEMRAFRRCAFLNRVLLRVDGTKAYMRESHDLNTVEIFEQT